MTWKMTSRDKAFRLQFYPSLGYILVFVFIFVFRNGKNMGATWAHLSETNSYLWFIYLPMFTIANSILLISYNENYPASWIYHSLPVERPGELVSAVRAAARTNQAAARQDLEDLGEELARDVQARRHVVQRRDLAHRKPGEVDGRPQTVIDLAADLQDVLHPQDLTSRARERQR